MEPIENTENQAPMPEKNAPKDGGIGPTLSIILIIILIALGGLYYFTQGIEEYNDGYTDENTEQAVQELQTQGTSDEVAEIEADLEATDFSEIDAMMLELEAELNAQ